MAKMSQLTVSCANRPGELARIAEILRKANVNILAFNAGSAATMSYLQFIVDHVNLARKALEANGFACYDERVLRVTLPNVPGALSRFTSKLAAKNINIGAAYQTTVEGSAKASVIMAVSNLEMADRIRY
jgi:hypothetical protein